MVLVKNIKTVTEDDVLSYKLFFLQNTNLNHNVVKDVLEDYYKQDLSLCFEENQKPYIKNSKNKFFNYSHSYNLLLIALNNTEIGVDTEKIRKINLNLMNKAFLKNEIEYVISHPKEKQDEAFLRIWTKKESYIKFLGKNIFFINKFDVFTIKNFKIKTDIVTLNFNGNLEKYIYSVCY